MGVVCGELLCTYQCFPPEGSGVVVCPRDKTAKTVSAPRNLTDDWHRGGTLDVLARKLEEIGPKFEGTSRGFLTQKGVTWAGN